VNMKSNVQDAEPGPTTINPSLQLISPMPIACSKKNKLVLSGSLLTHRDYIYIASSSPTAN